MAVASYISGRAGLACWLGVGGAPAAGGIVVDHSFHVGIVQIVWRSGGSGARSVMPERGRAVSPGAPDARALLMSMFMS